VSLLGDVIISIEKAKQQARERRHSQEEEMVALLIHGILHLLGYDHERSAREARIMKGMEKKIYRALCEQDLLEV
jgi:probable rRNA maturation factor